MDGHFLWVVGGGWRFILSEEHWLTFFMSEWRYILGGWWWVNIFYGRVVVGRGQWRDILGACK